MIFVSGHPGKTDRLNTVAHLEYLRDLVLSNFLDLLRRWEVLLLSYSDRGIENARRAQDELFGFQNSRKAQSWADWRDCKIRRSWMPNAKRRRPCVRIVNDDPQLRSAARPGTRFQRRSNTWEGIYNELQLLEQGNAFHCRLFHIARTLVRLAEERIKPNAERLRNMAKPAWNRWSRISFQLRRFMPTWKPWNWGTR